MAITYAQTMIAIHSTWISLVHLITLDHMTNQKISCATWGVNLQVKIVMVQTPMKIFLLNL